MEHLTKDSERLYVRSAYNPNVYTKIIIEIMIFVLVPEEREMTIIRVREVRNELWPFQML